MSNKEMKLGPDKIAIPGNLLVEVSRRVKFKNFKKIGSYQLSEKPTALEVIGLEASIKRINPQKNDKKMMTVSFIVAARKNTFESFMRNKGGNTTSLYYDFVLDSMGSGPGSLSSKANNRSFYKLIIYTEAKRKKVKVDQEVGKGNSNEKAKFTVELYRMSITFKEVKDKNGDLLGIRFGYLQWDGRKNPMEQTRVFVDIPLDQIKNVRALACYTNPETSRGTETTVQDDDE